MKIEIGKTAGFCYGVKRAVEETKKELDKNKRIDCLGELVHNKQVIEKLEKAGMNIIDEIEQATNKVIIRAHGVPKKTMEKAKTKDIEIIDLTCPKVLKIHEIAEEYAKQGYYIFLLGSKKHPENIGTISYCGKNSSIIENEEEALKELEKFEKSGLKKLLVISQTTYSLEKFYIIEEIIRNETKKDVELVIKNTICQATELRQKETEELSKKVNYMIIIGGKNSSNTKKLYEIAKKNCENSICIETKEEINIDEIKQFEKVGIMAGASTPQESINEVVEKIKEE